MNLIKINRMTGGGVIAVLVCATLSVQASAATGSGDETYTLRDPSGRAIELSLPAKRIVTIPMPAAPMLIGVQQGTGALVGMHPESRVAVEAGILGTLFPKALTLPTDIVGRGFMPNVEAVLSTHPDLVIQWDQRGNDLIAPLEAAGLKVAAVRYGSEQDVRDWLALFGAVTWHEAQAQSLIKARKDTLQRLAPLRALPDNQKPRVLYFSRVLSGLHVAGDDTFNAFSINAAGGLNAAAGIHGVKPVNREQVLAWNPDVILLNNFEPGLRPERITSDPLLGLTNAAQNHRVYNMPIAGYRWDPPSHESPLSWLWLAERLHPQALDIDMRAETRAFLTQVYGQPVGPDLLNRVFRSADQRAAGPGLVQ